MAEQLDLIIIGGGPAGYVGAIKAAQEGMKTALIERDLLGGTCLNRGCIPTKALMHCANSYGKLSELSSIGVSVENAAFNFNAMHDFKNNTVKTLRDGVASLLEANDVAVISGNGVITGAHSVEVGGVCYTAEHIMAASGSKPSIPPIKGSDKVGVFSSDSLLEGQGKLVDRLVIVGGGVIGVEIAEIYSKLGCSVTIVEALDRLLPMMDREISQNLSMIYRKRGITAFTSASVMEIVDDEPLAVRFSQRGKEQSIPCDGVLICTGRRPNTEGLFAANLDIAMNGRFVAVNERYESSIPSIVAVGDLNGRLQLAHAAEAQAISAVEYMLGKTPSVNANIVPSCVYTEPEIACVGVTADEAKAKGVSVRTGKYVMNGNAKTLIEQADRSFIKLVFESDSGKLLGAQLMCPRATDMIAELTLALVNGLDDEQLLLSLSAHPTFSEAVTEAVEASHGNSIHTMPARRTAQKK